MIFPGQCVADIGKTVGLRGVRLGLQLTLILAMFTQVLRKRMHDHEIKVDTHNIPTDSSIVFPFSSYRIDGDQLQNKQYVDICV